MTLQQEAPSGSARVGGLVDAIAAVLQREGVKFLSCYPTTSLIDAAARASIRPIVCRQERTGVHIADGFTRTTAGRETGVFASQLGPGLENAYPGIATAFADSVPMLYLPVGYQASKCDMERFASVERLRGVSKSIERIRQPDRVYDVLRRAFSRMRSGRPGPAVVEIPVDIADSPVTGPTDEYVPVRAVRSAGDPTDIDAAASLLAGATRPVIFAGQGVLYAQATSQLVRLAEMLDAAVATTVEGKSCFPEHHPLSLGAAGLTMPQPLHDSLAEADVVLGIGVSFTGHFLSVLPSRASKVIHVTADPYDLHKDVRADCAIAGDAQLVLLDLLQVLEERLPEPVHRGTQQLLATRRRAWLSEWSPLLQSSERPINPYRVVDALMKVLDPAKSIVTHDSGSPRDQLLPFYRASQPHGYLGWGKAHALGSGLGLIMGAKLARPEWTCVNLMGDAAFGMVGLDFETAVRNEIPIVCVVNNNQTMAVETDTLVESHDRYATRDIGGDYAEIARCLGGWATRVDDPAALEMALRQAIAATREGRAALVEVITSPLQTPWSCRRGPSH